MAPRQAPGEPRLGDQSQWVDPRMIFTLKLGSDENLPSGKHTKSELENGPVKIVDFPSYKIVILRWLHDVTWW